jgi:hypothetical protein
VKLAPLLAERLSVSAKAPCSIGLVNFSRGTGLLKNEHRQVLNAVSKEDTCSLSFKMWPKYSTYHKFRN